MLNSYTYFSIGGGFIHTRAQINQLVAPLKMESLPTLPFGFDSAKSMLRLSHAHGLSIAQMKKRNELEYISETALDDDLDSIWQAMQRCIEHGLTTDGILPGDLNLPRRAKELHQQLQLQPDQADVNDWLCAYAMAVNEENAAEIALEHHLGMTCDPVGGLVQIPCIERNGFGAIKAYTAASLAIRGNGEHFMPLDHCIAAMKQTGEEMSHKFKETSLGGLAVNITEC